MAIDFPCFEKKKKHKNYRKTLQVNKQSIKRLLESGKEQMFLIPEYQRPYSWTENETKTFINNNLFCQFY